MDTADMDQSNLDQQIRETEHEKLRAEVSKLIAETGQVRIQTLLAPFLAAAGVIGATAAVVKILFT